ncbi:phosphoribosylpyrophosphate synthetase [Chitinophagaceae bacterium MMS25-I14]
MKHMDTLSQTMEVLRGEGYTVDFNLQRTHLAAKDLKVLHDEFIIDQVYRFEGMSDPADEATLYAISAPKYDIKGVLVNGMGVYTDELADEMLEALNIRKG